MNPCIIPLVKGISRPPLLCEYGTPTIFQDVTDLVLKHFTTDNVLTFPSAKKFNHYFTDTAPYQIKQLTILVPDNIYLISEDDTKEYQISLQRNLITFIIPTINRPTLIHTLNSLEAQNDDRWEAICVFDQVQPSSEIKEKLDSNPRFRYEVTEKLGQGKNSGGLVRNYGMSKVTTEWIGFVDDDDILTTTYTESLHDEIARNKEVQCIIFRILNTFVIPAPKSLNFVLHDVGISFAYRTELFKAGFQFTPSFMEDYVLLDKIRKASKKIVLSPHITYVVREQQVPENIERLERNNLRVIIN